VHIFRGVNVTMTRFVLVVVMRLWVVVVVAVERIEVEYSISVSVVLNIERAVTVLVCSLSATVVVKRGGKQDLREGRGHLKFGGRLVRPEGM
jgi:hypothetical protein